jgi:hypothetical protein
VPDFSVTRVGSIEETTSPSITSTPRFSRAFFVYERIEVANIGRSAGPASTRMMRALSWAIAG